MTKNGESADQNLIDAIALLKSDHRKVEDLFVQYESADDQGKKKDLSARICMELKIHTMIEEEIFYPALQGKIEEDLIGEAFVEHDGAKILVNDIANGSPDDDFFDAKVTVLKEQVKHHVKEEEMPETGMFAQARASGVDLNELGAQLKARKEELTAIAKDEGLPSAKPAAVEIILE